MVALLKRVGYSLSHDLAESPEQFAQQLEKADYDVILADYNLRTCTAMDALEVLKKSGKDVPFVVVTGTLGDEAVVECIKQGAADYVLKHRLQRLPVVVHRALRDKAHREEAAQPEEAISPGAPLSGGSETIRLLEDEEGVRDLAGRILELKGHKVITASNPTEAAQVCARHEGPIHLLLTDVVMPTMSGRQLAEHLAFFASRVGGSLCVRLYAQRNCASWHFGGRYPVSSEALHTGCTGPWGSRGTGCVAASSVAGVPPGILKRS